MILQFSLALLVANRCVDGDWVGAVLAFAALLALFTRWPIVLAVLAVSLLAGQFVLAALLAVGLALQLAPEVLPIRWISPRFDPNALTECLRALPTGVVAGLPTGVSPVSTATLVTAARRDDPDRWKPLGDEPAARDEGTVIDVSLNTAWTQAAAESAALARHLAAELSVPLDLHLLAGAATWIPGSVAATWAGGDAAKVPEGVLGIYSAAFFRSVSAFSNSPEGADVARRWEILARVGGDAGRLPPEAIFDRTGRTAPALRRQVRAAPVSDATPIVSRSPAPVPATPERIGERLPKTAKPIADATPQVSARRRPSPSIPSRRPTPRIRDRYRDAYRWRAAHRGLWHGLRPVATVSIPLVAAVTGESGVVVAALATGAVMIRPVHRDWAHVGLAACVLFVSLPAALAVVVRGLLSEMTLLGLGAASGTSGSWRDRRRAGIDRLAEARQRLASDLLDEPDLGTASHIGLDHAGVGDVFTQFDAVLRSLTWAWSVASAPALGRALVASARGLAFGRWPGAPRLSMEADLGRTAAILALTTGLIRAGGVIVAAGFVAMRYPLDGIELGSLTLGGNVRAAAAAAAATLVLAGDGRWVGAERVVPRFAAASVLTFLVGRDELPAILAVAVAVAALTLWARRLADHMVVAGIESAAPTPIPRWRPGLRRLWVAAARTEYEGRLGLALRQFDDLAASIGPTQPVLAAAARGRAGELRVRRGQLQAAAEAAQDMTRLLDGARPRRGIASPMALTSRGRIRAELGDWLGAEADLRDAFCRLPRWSAARTGAALLLADTLARLKRPDDAAAALLPIRPTLVLRGGLDRLFESEVAISAGYYAAGATATARSRLQEAMELLDNDVSIFPLGRRIVERAAQAYGRGQLLLGRIELDEENYDSAAQALALAVTQLGSPRERGAAMVLRGVAAIHVGGTSPGVSWVRDGLRSLEAVRGQLLSGDQRAQVIIAEEEVYDRGLGALALAQASGSSDAGDVAAECIESLRRSALAALLRSGGLALSAEAVVLLEGVARLERGTAEASSDGDDRTDDPAVADKQSGELQDLRERIAVAVSDRFAAAYLPQPVDIKALRARAGGAHVLSYYLPNGRLPGWVVWMRPGNGPVLRRVATDDERVLGLIEGLAQDTGLRPAPTRSPHLAALRDPMDETADVWRAVTELLLPGELCAQLDEVVDGRPVPLVVVPDGLLALFPWGALRTPADRLVVDLAVLQIVPTLELLVSGDGPGPSPTVLAHLDLTLTGSDFEQSALGALGATFAGSRDEFVANLTAGAPDVVYLAAHGKGDGLDQAIAFGGGEVLSAAQALAYKWAPTSIFASCFVGRYAQRAGREPLGIAVACLLGGARSIVGGVVAVSTAASPIICTAVAAAVCAGRDPAIALRDAQRSYLAQHDLASVHDCLGFVCISTLEPSFTAEGVGGSVREVH